MKIENLVHLNKSCNEYNYQTIAYYTYISTVLTTFNSNFGIECSRQNTQRERESIPESTITFCMQACPFPTTKQHITLMFVKLLSHRLIF